jgi:hypothetical protein
MFWTLFLELSCEQGTAGVPQLRHELLQDCQGNGRHNNPDELDDDLMDLGHDFLS